MANRRAGKRVVTPDGVRVRGKNANREGSVYRQADGRWCATWWVPGAKRPRKATGKTRDAAIERRAKRQSEAGLSASELRTVGAVAEWWLHNVHKQAVRPSSWAKGVDRVRRIKETLGDRLVGDVDYRTVTEWQAKLLAEGLAPNTVRVHRQALAQVLDEAVKLQIVVGNAVRSLEPLRIPEADAVALDVDQAHALINQAREHRLGAAVAALFLQGWRVSEVLGLAWEDLDLDAGVAHIRRASVYVDGRGQQLGETKSEDAFGKQWLMPTVAELLATRLECQTQERAEAPVWETHTYDGEPVSLVFTTPTGGLVLRQTIAKLVKQAAKSAGIDAQVATHTGRRTVITALFDEGDEKLEDIAAFGGHSRTSTTAGYVKRRKRHPQGVSKRAAALLDGGSAVQVDDELLIAASAETTPDEEVHRRGR